MVNAIPYLDGTNLSKEQVTQNQPTVRPSNFKPRNYKFILFGVCAVMLLLLISVYLLIKTSTESTDPEPDAEENNCGEGLDLQLVPREEWFARLPNFDQLSNLSLPVHRVIIANTRTYDCKNQTDCIAKMKRIQAIHIAQDCADIMYNFLVGGDGAVYEGRGWGYKGSFYVDSIYIAFIGAFDKSRPPKCQINAAKWIIAEGVRMNKIVQDYLLYSAKQLMATNKYDGVALFEIVKKWPHWSSIIM